MTEPADTGHTGECGADVAAYALGALEPAEARAFRRHLDKCVVCRDELTAFQQVVDLLPLAVCGHAPPPELRQRLLSEVERERGPVRGRRLGRRWRRPGE